MTSTTHHHSKDTSAGAAPEGPPAAVASSIELEPKTMKENILDTVTSTLQSMKPVKKTHHHASAISDDLIQCAVFD